MGAACGLLLRLSPIVSALALLLAAALAAQELGDRRAGHDFAMQVCSECHWVSDEQMVIPENEAPSFFQVAEDPAITPISLRVFFGTPHQNMPGIMLSDPERDDVIAYILSLRELQ